MKDFAIPDPRDPEELANRFKVMAACMMFCKMRYSANPKLALKGLRYRKILPRGRSAPMRCISVAYRSLPTVHPPSDAAGLHGVNAPANSEVYYIPNQNLLFTRQN